MHGVVCISNHALDCSALRPTDAEPRDRLDHKRSYESISIFVGDIICHGRLSTTQTFSDRVMSRCAVIAQRWRVRFSINGFTHGRKIHNILQTNADTDIVPSLWHWKLSCLHVQGVPKIGPSLKVYDCLLYVMT